MVFGPLFQHIISALLVGLFLALGIVTFGDPFLFDRIFFASLIIIAIAFKKDVNLLGVTLIIITERVLEEGAYFLIVNSLPLKGLTYLACLYALYLRRNDSLFYPILISLLLIVSAEIYWWLSDYTFLNIHWYVFLITLNLFVRKAISSRCFWTLELIPNSRVQPLKVDYYTYQLALFFIGVNLVTLAEYIARHLFSLDSLFIYKLYPLMNHILAFVFLFLLADQAIKVTQSRKIKV